MKKVYIELKNGLPVNVDIQNAIDGFIYLGYEPVGFTKEQIINRTFDYRAENNPFVGSIDTMTILFNNLGKYPEPIDFPESIIKTGLLNREITKMKLNDFIEDFKINKNPRFIKPLQTKLFDGTVIINETQLNYLNFDNCDVFVSKPIDIISEHRIYIHNKKAIYSCNYSGDFRINPYFDYVDLLIENYQDQPVAYTIDIAILRDKSITVVEFNDFWSIGSYGLFSEDYAKMLLDRYNQIIK